MLVEERREAREIRRGIKRKKEMQSASKMSCVLSRHDVLQTEKYNYHIKIVSIPSSLKQINKR